MVFQMKQLNDPDTPYPFQKMPTDKDTYYNYEKVLEDQLSTLCKEKFSR